MDQSLEQLSQQAVIEICSVVPQDVENAVQLVERQALQAAEALRLHQRQYQTLIEAIPQLVWMTTADGMPVYFNQQWLDYTNYSVTENLDENWSYLLHPDDWHRAASAWQEAVATGEPYEVEYRLRRQDGIYRWFLVRGVPLKDDHGQIRQWVGTLTDINAKKQQEQTQAFLNSLNDQIRPFTDPDRILQLAVELVGGYLQLSRCHFSDVDILADRVSVNNGFFHETEPTRGLVAKVSDFGSDLFVESIRKGRTVVVENTATHPFTAAFYETAYQPIQVKSFVIVPCLSGGECVAALVSDTRDLRLWPQEDIALLETVAHRTWLSVENARLFQAERERSKQLALAIAEVHHRVKNNLQSVAALLEIQMPDGEKMMPVEAVRDSLTQIQTIALVHDLLSKDRPIGLVDTAQALRNLAQLLSQQMSTGEQPLRISVDAESMLMPTKLATALALVINELLTNAAKHYILQDGTDNERADIEIKLQCLNEQAVVTVRDHGPGFPDGFNPNQHAHIGLQVVNTLVGHDLQGHVSFSNLPGENGREAGGAIVEIIFPADLSD